MAGVMNVRADRSIQWPEKQEIGDLQLNFIKIVPKAHPLKRAIIAATPLFVGLLAIWLIAVNIFQLETVILTAGTGRLEDVAAAIGVLTSAPDFWLWFYISFTIANTMFPNIPKDMRGWWQIAGAIGVVVSVLVVLGIGQTFLTEITLSLTQLLNTLSLTLILILFINLMMVMGLGLIEYSIERITGHSATFQKGKMITMTRQEAIALREEGQQKRITARATAQRRQPVTELTSVYALELPIPGSPTQEPVTKGVAAVIGMNEDVPENVLEDDEIIETTATDSARQRRLRLFPETTDDNASSLDESDTQLLPESTSPSRSKTKQAFNVQAFEETPTSTPLESDESDKLEDKSVDTEFAEAAISIESSETSSKSDSTIDEVEDKAVEFIAQQKVKKQAGETPQNQTEKTTEQTIISSETDTVSTASLSRDEISDSDEIEDKAVASSQPSWHNQLTKPILNTDDNDEEVEKDATFARPFARSTPTDEDMDEINEDKEPEEKSTSFMSSAEFPRPFVPRDLVNLDNDDDDEQLDTKTTSSSNIFDSLTKDTDTKAKSSTTNWRDSLNDLDNDDDDDDEQLGTKTTSRSNVFDSLTKDTNTKAKSPTTNWRNALNDLDNEDNDEDEQLTSSPTSSSNIFDSLAKDTDTKAKSPTTNWRNALNDLDDEDNDDEQLDTKTTSRSNVFDSLTKDTDTKTKSPTTNWRDSLNDLDDEGDDDGQLDTKTTSRSNVFDSLTKDTNTKAKSPTTNWRNALNDLDDEDDDDEQLTSSPTSRPNIFDSLTKDTDTKAKSPTTNWRSQITNLDQESEEDDKQSSSSDSIVSGLNRPKSDKSRANIVGSGSRQIPKPSQKSSDWRSQLTPSTDDEIDEDDNDIIYEDIDDELIYEDDDDSIYYEDDDDDIYYDD